MPADEIHIYDFGTIFVVTLKDGDTVVDISGAVSKFINFKKPDGTTVSKNGVFTSDGTDGKMQYTIVSGDLDQLGLWELQAHIIGSGSASQWKSDITKFQVHRNIV